MKKYNFYAENYIFNSFTTTFTTGQTVYCMFIYIPFLQKKTKGRVYSIQQVNLLDAGLGLIALFTDVLLRMKNKLHNSSPCRNIKQFFLIFY